MRDDEKFNINFVKKIESYKCLYDYTRCDYKNVHIQEKAWAEIAEEFKDSVSSCKERWRNLRGCYTRHLKQKANLTIDTGRYRKPYYLATYMDFIYPFTKSRGSMNSTPNSSMNESKAGVTPAANDVKSENSISLTITNLKGGGDDSDNEHEHQTSVVGEHESIQNQGEEQWVTEQQDDENITIEQATQNTPGGQIIITAKDDSIMLPSDTNHPLIISSSTPCITSLTSSDSTTNQIISQLSRPMKRKYEETSPQLQKFQIIQDHQTDSGNADLYFLKSLLPDIQSMIPSQKRKLRIGFLNVIDSILSEG